MKIKKNTITFKLIFWILIIIVPIIVFIIFQNWYAIKTVRNQVSISNRGTLSLYVQQIEETLTGAEKYLANLAFNNETLSSGSVAESDYEKYMRARLLLTEISSAKVVYPKIDGFFIVSISDNAVIQKNNGNQAVEEIEKIRQYLTSLSISDEDGGKYIRGQWFNIKIGEYHYLFRVYKTNSYYIGAWANNENLLKPLKWSDFGIDKQFALASKDGELLSNNKIMSDNLVKIKEFESYYYIVGNVDKYLLLSEGFQKNNLYLIALIKEEGILEGLDSLQRGITLMSFLSILIVPLSLYLINRSVLSPLKRIVLAMLEVKNGNMEVAIQKVPLYDEYVVVKDTFKEMLQKIKKLRIDVYEEQLLKQKAELQYYQLQINPHFLMNALNIIYGLAEVKKFEIIQEMTMSLAKYFRFILSMSSNMVVDIRQEMEHVLNYLHIQELRFPENIAYTINIQNGLESALIPPILFQSFVENSIKYATDADIKLEIMISIEQKGEYLSIHISDNGEGYPENILRDLNLGKKIIDERGEHIGLYNILQRLDIIFLNKVQSRFYNRDDGGAAVDLILPLIYEYKER